MGEPGAALRKPGSREGNLPAGVNLPAGGGEGSDDSPQGESRESGVTPTSLQSSEILGEGGASVKGGSVGVLVGCGTCKKALEGKHGFVNCALLPKWQWLSPKFPCAMNPPLWEKREHDLFA